MSDQPAKPAKANEARRQSQSEETRQKAKAEVDQFSSKARENKASAADLKEFMARAVQRRAEESETGGEMKERLADAADIHQQLGDDTAADADAGEAKAIRGQAASQRSAGTPPDELPREPQAIAAQAEPSVAEKTGTQAQPERTEQASLPKDAAQAARRRLVSAGSPSDTSPESQPARPDHTKPDLAADSLEEARPDSAEAESSRPTSLKHTQGVERPDPATSAGRTRAESLAKVGDRRDEQTRPQNALDAERESRERVEQHLLQDRSYRLGDQPDDRINFAILFAGGNYGRVAEDYYRAYCSNYILLHANSMEEAEAKMANVLRSHRTDSGAQPKIRETVLITHANEYGVLKIPLTEQDARRSTAQETVRPLSPWGLASLRNEIQAGQHAAFVEDRDEVLRALDRESWVRVAGCNFGRSTEGLQALHAFFGGQAEIYAPVGLQVFEVQPVGGGQDHLLVSRQNALKFLKQQDQLPPETDPAANKRQLAQVEGVLRRNGGSLPTQAFIAEDKQEEFRHLTSGQQLSAQAEYLKTRPALPDPGLRHTLAQLSPQELAEVAHDLEQSDRPGKSLLVWAARKAWDEKTPKELAEAGFGNAKDPLGGQPPFGSSLMLDPDLKDYTLEDPWRSSRQAGANPETPGSDPFLEGRFPTAEPANRDVAEREFNQDLLERAAEPASLERPYSAKGFVTSIPNGLRLSNFAIGRADLRSEFEGPLRDLVQQWRANPDQTMVVTGHASTLGGVAANERVALARAQTVASFLVQSGVANAKVVVVGQGEHNPLQADMRGGKVDSERAAHNRRVEVHLVSDRQNPTASENETSRVALAVTAEQNKSVAETVKAARETVDETQHKVLEITKLTLHGVEVASEWTEGIAETAAMAEVAEVAGAAALGAGVVSIVAEYLGIVVSLANANEATYRAGLLFGFKSGLEIAKTMSAEQLGRFVTAKDLEKAILQREHDTYTNNWTKEIRDLPLDQFRANGMERGLLLSALIINQVDRAVETAYRHSLESSGLTLEQTDRLYREKIQGLRRHSLQIAEKAMREQIAQHEESE